MMSERTCPFIRTRSISPPYMPLKADCLLSLPVHQQPQIRIRALLGHCLYRRVIIWSLTLLALVLLTLYTSGSGGRTTPAVMLEELRKSHYWEGLVGLRPQGEALGTTGPTTSQTLEDEVRLGGEERINETEFPPHWLKYRHLDGYFYGLKALVPYSKYRPEFPRKAGEKSPYPLTVTYNGMPTPAPFVPHPDYKSSKYIAEYHEVKTCYLDPDSKVPAPDLYAYNGLVQGQPKPVIGSHNLLGIRDDICWDRFGRYGPYGMGYNYDEGGVFEGMDTEKAGSKAVWSKTGKINYNLVDWADAQERCLERNKRRFSAPDEDQSLSTLSSAMHNNEDQGGSKSQTRFPRGDRRHGRNGQHQKIDRIAIVIRTYVGFHWTPHAILNFRAMISELSLRSGGEYAVHFLLHVHDNTVPIWADAETAQRVLDDNVPPEFHGLCTLWSEAQMQLLYPGDFGATVENPSQQDIHGVYRSAHMPLQHFALSHPQYAHFWNWEMDMRWLGNYYELFDRLGIWARNQSRAELWERNQKYYIPHVHGSWEDFTALVHAETEASGRRPVMGPVLFAGRKSVRSEEQGRTFLPASCTTGSDPALCGVGEEADLISLNPLFDAEKSGWVFASDVTGYDTLFETPPRRCAIITASRLSRRLLAVMHEETWRMRHSMFSEMFPATMALHHGLKAVYAPHPVFIDREWEMDVLDRSFNGGRDGSTSGHGSPFDLVNEHNHKGTSWYFNSEFSGLLWRRWLGFAQMDGRGGRDGEGMLRGGREEEGRRESTGRLCLRSMLVHPVKWEHPDEGPEL